MSLFINISNNVTQNPHLFFNALGNENFKWYAKIAAIALAIIGTIGALCWMLSVSARRKKIVPATPNNTFIQPLPMTIPPTVLGRNDHPVFNPITPLNQAKPIYQPIQRTQNDVPPAQNPIQQHTAPAKEAPFAKQVERVCSQITENIFADSTFSAQKAFSAIDQTTHQQIITLFNELVAEFEKSHYIYQKIGFGDAVPPYFANVKNETESQRKYLSLVGIRNMLKYGPNIVDDFRDKKFIGGEHHYGINKGLQAFKYYTGNAVDLDTEIDATNDQEALLIARERIVKFGKICGLKGMAGQELTAEQVTQKMPERKLDIPQRGGFIHDVGQSNTDRSNHGIWKRTSPMNFKTHYFVNVPDCDIVLIATLRLPYLIAELAYRAKESGGGVFPKHFLDDLFQNGISDMCFNDKVRQFMDFYMTWSAKFDGSLQSPEDEVRKTIEKGDFGETLRLKGADAAIKEAYDRNKLIDFFNVYNYAHNPMQSEDQWINNVIEGAIEILKVAGLWENVLYRSGEGQDYFLLNKSTLALFLKDYYSNYLPYV